MRDPASSSTARRALVLCAACLVGVVVAFSWRSAPAPAPPERSAAGQRRDAGARADEAAQAVIYESQNPRAETREPRQVSFRRRSEAAGTRVARSFLRAYLPFEVGDGSSVDRARMVELASPELGVELAEGEPRVPLGLEAPAEAELVALDGVYAPRQRRSMTAAATLERAGERSTLLLTLVRREGEWRVDELGR